MTTIRRVIGNVWALVLREPVYTQALVVAAIAMGSAFGLGWNGAQVAAVSAFSAAFLAFLTKQAVTPLSAPVLPQNTIVTVATPSGRANATAELGVTPAGEVTVSQ
jgi:hypothetical protein